MLTNAVLHASTDLIELRAQIDGRTVTITVCDFGRWRERLDTRPEGGLGLVLVERLVEDVQISRGRDGTRVTLRAASA